MTSTPNYLRNDVILVYFPFSDLSGGKIRPTVVVHAPHPSQDNFVIPLTSQTTALLPGEFILRDWSQAGLNVPSALKRGIFTADPDLVVKRIGQLSRFDAQQVDRSLRLWLGL